MATERASAFGYGVRAKWATVRVETERAVYVGRVYVPETKRRLSDVLSDDRPFLNLTEVSTNDGEATETFVAVSKRSILTVRVLNEGEADVAPISNRN